MPRRPPPIKNMLNGSGFSPPGGALQPQLGHDPMTIFLSHSLVPKLKLAPVTGVAEGTPHTLKLNVTVPFRKGLSDELPAIEWSALVYLPPGPAGPMIV